MLHSDPQQSAIHSISGRKAGGLLVAATLLEVLAMAHHPSVRTPDIAEAVTQIGRLAGLSAWVHGLLIALMLTSAYVFAEYSYRRGLARPTVRAALIAYAAGVFALIIAATMSGFVITQVAMLTPHATPTDLQTNLQLLILCRVLNQSFANLGVVAMSAAILFWGLDLLGSTGKTRLLGALGLLIAILPAAGLLSGMLHLDVVGMMRVVLLQSVWNLAVGVLLIHQIV